MIKRLGKKVWVSYKLDYLWMSSRWQNLRTRVIVVKTVTLTSVVMLFPPAPSSLLWFPCLGSCSNTLQEELLDFSLASKYLYYLCASLTSLSHVCFLCQIRNFWKTPSISVCLWIPLTRHWSVTLYICYKHLLNKLKLVVKFLSGLLFINFSQT